MGKEKIIEAENLFVTDIPHYEEGFDEQENTIVRLVSNHRNKKPYQVTGIQDVAADNNWKAWIYLGPILVLLVVFLIYPLVNTIFISFLDNYNYVNGTYDGFTFDNFGIIFGLTTYNGVYETDFTTYAIPNTFILVFLTVPLTTIIALLISVALNSIKWFKNALQVVFFLPYVTNMIAVGMVFSVIFDTNGVINYLFNLGETAWISGATRAMAFVPLIVYIVWCGLPFKILIFLSGLQGIDKQYYQAAQIDSAPHAKVLWRITVPLLSPQILYIVITSFIGAFKEYTAIVGLFNGASTIGTTKNMYTIVYYIYDNLNTQTSRAAAAAVFLFVIILICTWLQFKVSKRRVHY
jgi:multiple sugar transport system permease protein